MPGTYLTLDRTWASGHVVEVTLPTVTFIAVYQRPRLLTSSCYAPPRAGDETRDLLMWMLFRN